jgi:hypothetical protein
MPNLGPIIKWRMVWTKTKIGIVAAVAVVIAVVSYHLVSNHRISETISKGGMIPISGIVVDAHGQPIEGAIVSIPPNTSEEVKTDARGRFEFKLQTKWAMEMESDRKSAAGGDEFTQSYIFVRDTAHNLAGIGEVGKVMQKKTITLTPALTITGKVVDEHGTGVKGTRVLISLSPKGVDWDAYFAECVVLTDDQGKYEIPAIPFVAGGHYGIHLRWKLGKTKSDIAGQINMASTGEIEVKDGHSDAQWPALKDESGQVEINTVVVANGEARFQ